MGLGWAYPLPGPAPWQWGLPQTLANRVCHEHWLSADLDASLSSPGTELRLGFLKSKTFLNCKSVHAVVENLESNGQKGKQKWHVISFPI